MPCTVASRRCGAATYALNAKVRPADAKTIAKNTARWQAALMVVEGSASQGFAEGGIRCALHIRQVFVFIDNFYF